MKAIDYLKQIEVMDAKINSNIEELAQLEALATKTTSVLGGERVQSSGSQDKMAECVVKIADLQTELNKQIDEYIEFKNQARDVINECDADCLTLLKKRYFFYK